VNGRVLVSAGVAGVLGAVLVAVLVLGSGDRTEALTIDQAQAEGGVVWVRADAYERPPFEGSERSSRTVTENWTVWQPDEPRVAYLAVHTLDGRALTRFRVAGDGSASDVLFDDLELDWPVPRGHDVGDGEPSCDPGVDLVPAERSGAVMCVTPYPQPAAGHTPSAVFPAWPVDLDVTSVRREDRYKANGGPASVIHRATLEDGSTIVIASLHFHTSVLTLAEWEEIRAIVFDDVVEAGA